MVSLGYILGLVSLSLATLLWYLLRPRLAPAQRAALGWLILAGTFVLNSVLALVIFLGVVNERILMTTPYFHHLMYGGWGMAITAVGGALLLVSLALTWNGWRRGRFCHRG